MAISVTAAREAEGLRRLHRITVARSIALVLIMGLIVSLAPASVWGYYLSLVVIFIAIGWVNFALARKGLGGRMREYAATALDFAFLTFTLIYPPPNAPPEVSHAFYLRFDNFDYLYVILTGLAISLRPALLIWGGVCGMVFYGVGLFWLIETTGADTSRAADPEDRLALVEIMANPNYVDLGIEFQGMAIFLISAVLLAIAVAASQRLFLKQVAEERRAANLSRYLPAETVETLAGRDDPFGAEEEVKAAILFTDIVGFSAMAEHRAPREVIALLRDAHALVAEQVFAHDGMLDKFIGDGAMATFGVAGERGDDVDAVISAAHSPAARAIACARAILDAADRWNAARGGAAVRISVGVHYGPVVVGDVGSSRRMELAVIGDAVNVAARLEEMTRSLGVGAAISGDAVRAAGDPDDLRPLGPQTVIGRSDLVEVWTLKRDDN
ncbi:MAG: adenylate/guanylate cyclase domain-containing protein [Pseudomonadota bacterium]